MLFSATFHWEAKREQIFWVIIDISTFAVGFEIAKEKLNLPLSELGDVLSNPEIGNYCPRIFFQFT